MLNLPKAAKTQWAKVNHRSSKSSDYILVSLAQRPWYPGMVLALVISVSQAWAVFIFIYFFVPTAG